MPSYFQFQYDFPEWVDEKDKYELSLPYVKNSVDTDDKKRVMFVVEHVPDSDLSGRKFLNGPPSELLQSFIQSSCSKIGLDVKSITWTAINWNAWRTYGQTTQFKTQSELEFHKRVVAYASIFKPTHVIVFGWACSQILNANAYKKGYFDYNIFGVPFNSVIAGHKVRITCTIPLHLPLEDDHPKGKGPTNLLGFMARNVQNGIDGTCRYKISQSKCDYIVIDSIPLFDEMMKELRSASIISIDTETDSLNRRAVKMLTAQFCTVKTHVWFLPFKHKDSKWKKEDRKYIARTLAKFFETSKSKYHIYHNGKFDLSVLKANTGYRYYKAPVWDTMNGQYLLDENVAPFISMFPNCLPGPRSLKSGGYFTLANLAAQYSYFPWKDLEFGKENRETIKDTDLSPALVEYSCIDALAPLYIHEQQRNQAKDIGHEKYVALLLGIESDKVLSFADMEYNGIPTDVEYMKYMGSSDSPINRTIEDAYKTLNETDCVRSLNKKLVLENGVPKATLYSSSSNLFKPNKKEHLQRLFFEELGLEPLEEDVKGNGRLDKAFKTHYKDNEIVALYEKVGKAEKLRNSFVTPYVERIGVGDMGYDERIRPSMSGVYIVTGRIAESNPNMQQIPNKGLGVHIKRQFACPKDHVFFKTDFVAHEVRGWSLISGDKVLGEVFSHGLDLRVQFQLNPSKELAELIFLEGDSHRLNIAYFFKVDLKKMMSSESGQKKMKELRDQIKVVIFGLIYGKAVKTLARDLSMKEKDTEKLVTALFSRFKQGANWLRKMPRDGRKNLFVESPTGRRRYLWTYMLPEKAENSRMLYAAADRKSQNSPIQGMCSDFNFISSRLIQKKNFEYMREHGDQKFWSMNVVHDSQESLCHYDAFWWAIPAIMWSMTTGVQEQCLIRYGFDFTVPLEIDMELGPAYSTMNKWDWSMQSLAQVMAHHLVFHEQERGFDLDPAKELKRLFVDRKDEMPDWCKKQIKNVGSPDLKQALAIAKQKFKPSEYRQEQGDKK